MGKGKSGAVTIVDSGRGLDLTDVVLVPTDTVALLGINCVWRPCFDNATRSNPEDYYCPAIIPNMFVFPLLVHMCGIGLSWDYYADLFGNQTEWRIQSLLDEKRYDDALTLVGKGCGVPKPEGTPKVGLYHMNSVNAWAPMMCDAQATWREQWTKRISDLASNEAKRLGTRLKTAHSPEEWDKAAAELK